MDLWDLNICVWLASIQGEGRIECIQVGMVWTAVADDRGLYEVERVWCRT